MSRGGSNINTHKLYGSPVPPSRKALSSGSAQDPVNLRHLRSKDRAAMLALLEEMAATVQMAGLEMRYGQNATIAPAEGWTSKIMSTPFGPVHVQMRRKPETDHARGDEDPGKESVQ